MDFYFLLKGFAIAAPVGLIGILCIRRSLASGLGAATADGIYGYIAGFGLTIISDFLVKLTIYHPPNWGLISLLFRYKNFSKYCESRSG